MELRPRRAERSPAGPRTALFLLLLAAGILLGSATAALSPGLVIGPPSLFASPAQQPVGRRTDYNSGLLRMTLNEREFGYHTKKPEGEGTWPGVILLHTSMGLDKGFMKMADALAAEGFVVYAPDLYGGKIALDADKGRELTVLLDEGEASDIIGSLASHVKYLREVGDHRVGIVGFDAGGRWGMLAAMAGADVSALAIVDARPVQEVESLRRIPCPILALYGETDTAIPVTQIDAFRSALTEAGRTADVRVYPGAGHGFMMAGGAAHQEEAARDAWSLIANFLRDHL